MRSVEDTAVAFDRACRASGTAYAFVGGVAVAAWGQPRATTDVDALVVLAPEQADPLRDALLVEGLSVAARDLHDALREGGHVTVFDEQSHFHVDVALARTPAEREEVERAVDLNFLSGNVRVVRAEDIIAFKVLYGTPRDLQDARSILTRQAGRLDHAHLLALARRLRVEDALVGLMASSARDSADG